MTISKTFVRAQMEIDASGTAPAGYWALNASGKGQFVAEIAGPVAKADMSFGADGGKMADGTYALRDILDFAKKGQRGLSVVGEISNDERPAKSPGIDLPRDPYQKGDLGQF